MSEGFLPATAAWPATIAAVLLTFLVGITWSDRVPEQRGFTMASPVPPALSEVVGALVELHQAHAAYRAHEAAVAAAVANRDAARQSAADALTALTQRLVAAYPLASAPAGGQETKPVAIAVPEPPKEEAPAVVAFPEPPEEEAAAVAAAA